MKPLIIIALGLAISGCGGLDRGSAKQMIDAHFETHLQNKVIYPVTLGFTANCPISYAPIYRFLLQKKLIKITQPQDYELTDEGTKVFDAEGEHLYAESKKDGCDIAQLNVVLGHRGEPHITGIILDSAGTAAIVQYDRPVTLTPLGGEFAAFRNKNFGWKERISWRETAKMFNIPDSVTVSWVLTDSYTAHFVKFDDGWRISSIDKN
jgi:hypothetical protein